MQDKDDKARGMTRAQVTLRVLTEVANDKIEYLEFTGEESEGDRPVPVLDCQMWYGQIGEQVVLRQGGTRTGETPGRTDSSVQIL